MSLKVGFLGKLGNKELQEVSFGQALDASRLWSNPWDGSRLSDWLWLGDGNLDLLRLWNDWCWGLEGWVVARSGSNHLWHWKDWGRNLELAWMDVVLGG